MLKHFKYLSSLNLFAFFNQTFTTSGDGNNTRLDSDRGLGSQYKWINMKDCFNEAKERSKPIFLIIHRSTCPACQQLKYKFQKSVLLQNLSQHFVMVNVENGVTSSVNDEKYQPDGKYVPRILFFTSYGEFIKEAYNRHPAADAQHKYFYSSSTQVAETMLYVLDNYSKGSLTKVFSDEWSKIKFEEEGFKSDPNVIGPTILE